MNKVKCVCNTKVYGIGLYRCAIHKYRLFPKIMTPEMMERIAEKERQEKEKDLALWQQWEKMENHQKVGLSVESPQKALESPNNGAHRVIPTAHKKAHMSPFNANGGIQSIAQRMKGLLIKRGAKVKGNTIKEYQTLVRLPSVHYDIRKTNISLYLNRIYDLGMDYLTDTVLGLSHIRHNHLIG